MSAFQQCGWNGCKEDADQRIHARNHNHEFHGELCGRHAEEVIAAIRPMILQMAFLRAISLEALEER